MSVLFALNTVSDCQPQIRSVLQSNVAVKQSSREHSRRMTKQALRDNTFTFNYMHHLYIV